MINSDEQFEVLAPTMKSESDKQQKKILNGQNLVDMEVN